MNADEAHQQELDAQELEWLRVEKSYEMRIALLEQRREAEQEDNRVMENRA